MHQDQNTIRNAINDALARDDHRRIRQLVTDSGIDASSFLHVAAAKHSPECLRALLAGNADVDFSGDDPWTPLHTAIRYGAREAAAVLIAAGADLNARSPLGATPLERTIRGKLDLIAGDLIAAGADLGATNAEGLTALFIAAECGDLPVIDALLAAGADPNASTASGETPLMSACQQDNPEVIDRLVAAGADLHFRTRSGWGAISCALANEQIAIAQHLIDHHGLPPLSGAELERTLENAIKYARNDAITAMVRWGANPNGTIKGQPWLAYAHRKAAETKRLVRALQAEATLREAATPATGEPTVTARKRSSGMSL